jgi:cation diffusion facilitator CzcD-associated flavoprotein CzcO
MRRTELLVVGAGPYGMATAAYASDRGIDTAIVGRPMGFWREHMPAGMFLRSGVDWHLDATSVHTFGAYLEERGIAPADIDPVPIGVFLDYADWFRAQKGLDVSEVRVETIERDDDGGFRATLDDGDTIEADAVVAAPGIASFGVQPDWIGELSPDRWAHTCDVIDFDDLAGRRVLIVGGRQSAYEWAALMVDAGVARIDVVHRHDEPAFAAADWSFVNPLVETTIGTRGWWRSLPQSEREAIAARFWAEGRLKLEPWLTPRLAAGDVRRHARTQVEEVQENDAVNVRLSDGDHLRVDRVVLATGYRADMSTVPYLAGVLDGIEQQEGFPVLDAGMRTTLPGMYVTGFAATRDFGPFFGFVKASPAAASIIVNDLVERAG